LKCGAGEGRGTSFGRIMREILRSVIISSSITLYYVRSKEVLREVKEDKDILRTVKRRKADWIGYILRRNCFLKHVIEGKMDRGDGKTRKKT
jgi:hypothetical protein